MPNNMMIYFQNSSSIMMEHLIFFHDHIMMIIVMNCIMIFLWMIYSFTKKNLSPYIESEKIETFWTYIPLIMLFFVSIPSLIILYLMEENQKTKMSIKILGNQWYWNYEYSNMIIPNFDSIMINKIPRLLNLNTSIAIPTNKWIRTISSSNDVIHSWSIQSMGIKMDSIPGRLNQTLMKSNRSGLFSGQCSEICGMNHSFMPIKLKSMNKNTFISKIKSSLI